MILRREMIVLLLDDHLRLSPALLRRIDLRTLPVRSRIIIIRLDRTTLDRLDGISRQRVAHADAHLRHGVQHLEDEPLERGRVELGEERPALGAAVRLVLDLAVRVPRQPVVPALSELGVVLVLRLGGLPRTAAVRHGQEDDRAGPDVEGARVVVA